jgi:hypothetical protein
VYIAGRLGESPGWPTTSPAKGGGGAAAAGHLAGAPSPSCPRGDVCGGGRGDPGAGGACADDLASAPPSTSALLHSRNAAAAADDDDDACTCGWYASPGWTETAQEIFSVNDKLLAIKPSNPLSRPN